MKEIFIPTAKKYDGTLSFSPQTMRVCAGTDVPYRWRVFRSNLTAGDFSRAVMLLDAKYYAMVYINGHVAAQYITRGYDFDKHYDVLDITPFLRNGTNSFAILTHGFRGESPHDFALEVRLFDSDGERTAAFGTWRFADYPALSDRSNFFITSFGDEEIFDARIADEHIFDEDYDFSSWQEATLIEGNYTLVQSELKPQRIKPTAPERLIALEAFRERSGYDFHLAPAGRFVIAFMTEMTAKTDAEIFFRFTTSEHHLYLDGKQIDAQEKIKISAGAHKLAFYLLSFTPPEPEFLIEISGELDFCSVYFENAAWCRLATPAAAVEYPWNESPINVAVPEEIIAAVEAPTMSGIAAETAAKLTPAVEKKASHLHILKIREPLLTRGGFTDEKINAAMPRKALHVRSPYSGAESFIPSGTLTVAPPESADGACFMLDFGMERTGLIRFEINAPEGTKLELHGFELISDAGINYMGTQNTMTYICREGKQCYTAHVHRGFRYLAVYISDFSRPVTFTHFDIVDMRYDCNAATPFRSNDKALDTAYDMSLETAWLCMPECYVDCPGYEQSIWVGDARITAQTNMLNFGEYGFDKYFLRIVGESLDEPFQSIQWQNKLFDSTGRFFTFAAFPRFPRGGLPVWSFQWLLQIYDHYMMSGDTENLRYNFRHACIQLENCFMLTNSRGLLEVQGAWNLIEWAYNDLSMYGEVIGNNAMLVLCLRRAADMAEILGEDKKAKLFTEKAEAYSAAINKYGYSEEKRAYIDTVRDEYSYAHYLEFYRKKGRTPISYETYARQVRVSVQTNTLAYLAGIIPKEKEADAMRFLVDNLDKGSFVAGTPARKTIGYPTEAEAPGGYVHIGSPFFLFFAYDAICKYGRHDLMLKSIRREWENMAAHGTNTCWEGFGSGKSWTRSIAHGWSASPAIYLQTEILGIKPLEAGFTKFTVVPHSDSTLTYAEGAVATPYGKISVKWKKHGDGYEIKVDAPAECEYVK